LDFALEQLPKAIWLSFGNDICRWVKYIRDHDEKKGNNPKTLIFVQINSGEEARIASFDWKVDARYASRLFEQTYR
jgi:nitronate monooxygenase